MKRCHKCKKEWVSEKKQPAVKDYCDGCSAYLHCCLNCRFHDTRLHNECKIPTTDWGGDRAGANFCDEFEFADTEQVRDDREVKQKARDALGGLFGDVEPDKSKISLDTLFGD